MQQALDLVRGVRAAYQHSLGNDHPNTLVASNNLACCLRRTGQFPEALTLMAGTRDRMSRKLGHRHPLTLACVVNLANCHGDSGEPEPARTLGGKAIPLLREVLGDDHPDTLACEANLIVTRRQARAGDEEEFRIRILERLSQVMGPHHPSTRSLRAWQRIDLDLEALRI